MTTIGYDRMRGSKRRVHALLALTLIAFLKTACGSSGQPAPEPARFEETRCAVALPAGQTPDGVRCGVVTVAEDRSRANGRTVELPVVVLRATGATPSEDPVVFLNGGPGGPALDRDLQLWTAAFAAPIQATRDVVFFDQRGAGRSRPSLDCPEWRAAVTARLGEASTLEQDVASYRAALVACRDRLSDDGVDFALYTSAANAADLRDLMRALGYRQWNVLGLSYGTRLALTSLRDTPDEIRSVVLDSTLPPQVDIVADYSASYQRSLDTLFAGCAADPACDRAYPDLERTLFALTARLDAEPLTFETFDPVSRAPLTVVSTGARLLAGIQQILYRTSIIPALPLTIQTTARGDDSIVRASAGQFAVPSPIAWGVYYSIQCGEEFPFTSDEAIEDATRGVRPEVKHIGLTSSTLLTRDLCAVWGSSPPPAIENEPVQSDVPALVLAGEYDPITPPAYGALAARTLSRSTLVEFRGFGHGALRAQATASGPPACAMRMVASFLDDPAAPIDTRCAAELPAPVFAGS